MHSLSIFGLGIFFAIAGLGLFAFTLRKPPETPKSARKSDLRMQQVQQAENNKLRIAAAASVVVGAVLMMIS